MRRSVRWMLVVAWMTAAGGCGEGADDSAFGLSPGLVHEYTVYAKIGTPSELRAAFLELHQLGL